MTTNEQLELGFNGLQRRTSGRKQENRIARAAWWFSEMRRIVAGSMEWPAPGQSQATQTYFPGNHSK
jgi:hypothetical protein